MSWKSKLRAMRVRAGVRIYDRDSGNFEYAHSDHVVLARLGKAPAWHQWAWCWRFQRNDGSFHYVLASEVRDEDFDLPCKAEFEAGEGGQGR